jgi:hypothetical protein
MAKKISKNSTNKLAPEATVKRQTEFGSAEQRKLKAQSQRLKKTEAAEEVAKLLSTASQLLHPSISSEAVELPCEVREIAQAPVPPANPRVKVPFVFPAPSAQSVSVSGDFNGWSPAATPLNRHENGRWEATVDLKPGRYQYKFIVDGQWVADPLAKESVLNQHGTLNSVIEVQA